MSQLFNWVQVFESSDLFETEMITNYLKIQHEIEVQMVNKVDSMYLFGQHHLYVVAEQAQVAKDLIYIFQNKNYIA